MVVYEVGYWVCKCCFFEVVFGFLVWDVCGDVVLRVMCFIFVGVVECEGVLGFVVCFGYLSWYLICLLFLEFGVGLFVFVCVYCVYIVWMFFVGIDMLIFDVVFFVGFVSIC